MTRKRGRLCAHYAAAYALVWIVFTGIVRTELFAANPAGSIITESVKLISPTDAAGLKAARTKHGNPALEIARVAEEGSVAANVVRISTDLQGGYLPAVTQLSPTHFAVTMDPDNARMFLFKIHGVAGKTVRVDFQNINVHTWPTENPVYVESGELPAIGDIRMVDTDAERQLSQAYNGPLVPQASGGVWHFMTEVWRDQAQTLSVVQKFIGDVVIVAMKVPYTASMNDTYCSDLAALGGNVSVMKVGTSAEGKTLKVVRVTDVPEADFGKTQTVVMYAREHADEHDSSWVAKGAVDFLLTPAAAELRKHFVFLVIPLLDPDAATHEQHEGIISTFLPAKATPESAAYAGFFKSWIDAGRRIDLVMNLHNVESREGAHLFAPLTESERQDVFDAINDQVATLVQADGLRFRNPKKVESAIMPTRLAGWLRVNYGPTHIAFEANSEEGGRHLSVAQLCGLGRDLVLGSTAFLLSHDGQAHSKLVDAINSERTARWQKYGSLAKSGNALQQEARCLWQAQNNQASDLR